MSTDTDIIDLKTAFKEVRELFRETDSMFKETKSMFKDTDDKFKDTDAKFKVTDKQIRSLRMLFESQWGKLMESLVEGDLVNILRNRGIDIERTSTRVKGNHKGEQYEFDIIAHNGNEIVVVEVKTTLRVKDVNQHLSRLRKIKTWMREYKDFKVYGAVAFLKADEESASFAENKRLFVIKATGDSASIVNHSDFKPRIF